MLRGVIYARYSSDNQREESIEGQIRENKVYAERNDIEIVNTYIDRVIGNKLPFGTHAWTLDTHRPFWENYIK